MINLALSACRKRQSPRTGFVHDAPDTIPIFENFCFAFALFRQRTKEAFLEGKALLERLFSFQTEGGNFPLYLHDYPRCYDRLLPLKIAPILLHATRDFPSQLGSCPALERMLAYAKTLPPLDPLWEMRRKALFGENDSVPPKTARQWFEWLISKQLLHRELAIEVPYSASLQAFLGEHDVQEGFEPQPTPMEWLLAEEEGFCPRLKKDHFYQIHAVLLFPVLRKEVSFLREQGMRLLWGGSHLHSLFSPTGKGESHQLLFELSQPSEEEFEISLYCDCSPETELFINGKKGTLFRLGDEIRIATPQKQIDLQFELLEGEGDFVGHLSHANRPGQLDKGRVYDWKIGLRTLRRSAQVVVRASLRPLA